MSFGFQNNTKESFLPTCIVQFPSISEFDAHFLDIDCCHVWQVIFQRPLNTKESFLPIVQFPIYTVEPCYNEELGTMKITLLYQVSCYIRVKKQRNIKSWDQLNHLVIRGFCYIRPLYNEVPLYFLFCRYCCHVRQVMFFQWPLNYFENTKFCIKTILMHSLAHSQHVSITVLQF